MPVKPVAPPSDLKPLTPPADLKPAKPPADPVTLPPSPTFPGVSVPPAGVGASRVAPGVTVEALAPDSVAAGQDASFEVVVSNPGPVAVANVRVDDEMPVGAKYLGGDPVAEVTGTALRWNVGGLDVGASKKIKVKVRPPAEGDLRLAPRVTFTTRPRSRSR